MFKTNKKKLLTSKQCYVIHCNFFHRFYEKVVYLCGCVVILEYFFFANEEKEIIWNS